MLRSIAICLGLSAFSAMAQPIPPVADKDELFVFTVDAPTLSQLLRKPILKDEAVNERVKRTTLAGTAHLTGTVTVAPLPSATDIVLQMRFDSHTDVSTTVTGDGKKNPGEAGKSHPEVGYQFHASIGTTATTTKNILLMEKGLGFQEAATLASFAKVQEFGTLRTQAQGILPGRRIEVREIQTPNGTYLERERLGRFSPRRLPIEAGRALPGVRARAAIPQVKQEFLSAKTTDDARKSVVDKLTTQFNTSVWDELLPFHYKYLEYVYAPFIERGLLGGQFARGSNSERIAIVGTRGDTRRLLDVGRIAGATLAPIVMRVDEDFITEFAEKRLAGTMLSDVETAEMFGRKVAEGFTLRSNPQTVVYILEDKRPLVAKFADDTIVLSFRLRELTTLGKKLTKVQVTRAMKLVRGPASALALHHLPVQVTDFDDKPLEGELAQHIAKRFSAYAPTEPNDLANAILFEETMPMKVQTVLAQAGKLTLGLAAVEKKVSAQ